MYDNLVIGLTGSFNSGCHEVANFLKNQRRFNYRKFDIFSLSKKIKNYAEEKGIIPIRKNLQTIGNTLREKNGPEYLAKDIFDNEIDWKRKNPIIIKSIRNDNEAKFFRKKLINFYLINIDSPKKMRYEREQIKDKQEITSEEEFEELDRKDMGEEEPPHGQKVKKCVDLSDIVINNDKTLSILHKNVDKYLNLIKKPGSSRPSELEINMAQAYFWSLHSTCLSRKVGSIIVKDGYTIASGYNAVPKGRIIIKNNKKIETKIHPCTICYRDVIKRCSNENCSHYIIHIDDKCGDCNTIIDKNQKEALGKHLDLCKAIHAEERAILQTAKFGGQSLENTTLYTTTFPCLLCAKKIVEVGISKVVFIDPYPYEKSFELLEDAKVDLIKFEGVKSKKFDSLYVGNV